MYSHLLEKHQPRPKIADWLKHIEKIAEMENLVHQAKENPPKFQKMWACWIHFRDSMEFQDLLCNA